MDRQIPLLMGVSNSILENVIFCHQEESLWPFSDQANLKKIFDEIFETTKYTKALVELRGIKKKYNKFAKEYKHEMEVLEKDFEHYKKLKEKQTKCDSEMKKYELETEAMFEKIKEIQRDLEKNDKLEATLNLHEKDAMMNQLALTNLLNEYNSICKSMEVDDIDDPSLSNTDDSQRKQDEIIQKKEIEKKAVMESLIALKDSLNIIRIEKGNMQGNMKSKQDRFNHSNNELIQNLTKIFNAIGDEIEDTYNLINQIKSKNGLAAFSLIENVIENFKIKRYIVIEKYDKISKEFNDDLDSKEKELNIFKAQLELQVQNLKVYENKLQRLKSEEVSNESSKTQIEQIQRELEMINYELKIHGIDTKSWEDSNGNYSTPKKIRKATDELEQLCKNKNSIRKNYDEVEAEIESKKPILKILEKIEELSNRKSENVKIIESKTLAIKDYLERVSGVKHNTFNLDRSLSEVIDSTNKHIDKLGKEKESLAQKILSSASIIEQMNISLEDLVIKRENLCSKAKELAITQLEIELDEDKDLTECFPESLINQKFEDLCKERSWLKSEVQSLESWFEIVYNSWCESKNWFVWSKKLKKQEFDSIKTHLDEFVKNYSDDEEKTGDASEVDSKLKALIKIEFIINELITLTDKEIITIKEQIEELSQPILPAVLDQKESEITEEKEKLNKYIQMKYELSSLVNIEWEISKIDSQIQDLEETRRRSGDEGYTHEEERELIEKVSKLKKEYIRLEDEYEDKRIERENIQKIITDLQFKANELKEQRLKITQNWASLVETVNIINSTEAEIVSLKREICERQDCIEIAQKEIDELKNNKEDKMKEIIAQKAEVDEKWDSIAEHYIDCGRIKKTIINDKIDTDEIYSLQTQINDVIKKEQSYVTEIEATEQKIEQIKKTLTDLLNGDKRVELFRRGKKLKSDIVEVKEKIKKFRQYDEQIKDVKETKSRLNLTYTELKDRYNRACGYKVRLLDDCKVTEMEIRNPKYKDITRNLMDKEVRHTLAKLVAQEVSE